MKKQNNWVHTILRGTILVLTILLVALLIPKGIELFRYKQKESEWKVRNQEVSVELADVQSQIETLSGDSEALQLFLNEKLDEAAESTREPEPSPETVPVQDTAAVPETTTSQEAIVVPEPTPVPEQEATPVQPQSDPIPEPNAEAIEAMAGEAIIVEPAPPYVAPEPEPEKEPEKEAVSAAETVSQNTAGLVDRLEEEGKKISDTVSQNAADQRAAEEEAARKKAAEEAAASISWNAVIGEGSEGAEDSTISGNGDGTMQETVPDTVPDAISGNAVVDGKVIPYHEAEETVTLEERRSMKSSYEETLQVNAQDKIALQESSIDFSGLKIACLGDSLTAASNMDTMENYAQYSYPSVLKEVLHAEEVYNLGVGGSSYGRYWDKPFVERYHDIPKDADIILVMGGANDGFAASAEELGSLQERKKGTFYGDVDELMRGLKRDYKDARIVFATPLPNVLQDYLMKQRAYLLPQTSFVNAIKELATEYGIDVIDLYNANILDTHDTQVISAFMPDGVHGNQEGYRVLGEYLGSELIRVMQYAEETKDSGAQETDLTISGNGAAAEETAATASSNEVPPVQEAEVPGQPDAQPDPKPEETQQPPQYGSEAIVVQ